LFTIIIPTHDRPALLQRTLQSLIAQTCQDFQVVIVADTALYLPPYDEFLALQGRYTYVIRSGAPGPAASRNMGLALADSKYILFLDDDDTLEPGHLLALVEGMGSSSPEILFCDYKERSEDRTKTPPEAHYTEALTLGDVTKDSVFIRNRIPNSCLLFRRDVVAGERFRTELVLFEDWDFLMACLKDRDLTHLAIDSVVIHKSLATAPENLRRGNSRDDKIVESLLDLYHQHPGPNPQVRQARQALWAGAGIQLPLNLC